MIIIAFFFLLRPGEYTDNNKDPFRLADTQLFIGDTRLDLSCSPESELKVATFASLTFTSQKNGVRGEVIGLACSGDPYLCPVKAIIRRVLFLRSHSAPPSTPLARVFHTPDKVNATYLTDRISVRPSHPWARASGSSLPRSRPVAFAPLVRRRSFLPKWIPTSSASSAVGARTRCFAISTFRHTH